MAADLLTIGTIALIPTGLTVRRIYRRTAGSRATLARQLASLSCGIRSEFVEQTLGVAEFSRTKGRLTERVYVTRHAYVQTVADPDGSIVWWAITTVDAQFRPRFTLPPMSSDGQQWSVHLGRTRFSQLDKPSAIRWFRGARPFGYTESYWFGNPGNSLTYVASHSDLGVGEIGFEGLDELQDHTHGELPSGEWVIECLPGQLSTTTAPLALIRRSTVINTFGVGGVDIDLKSFPWTLGADSDHVRILRSVAVSYSGRYGQLREILRRLRSRSKG